MSSRVNKTLSKSEIENSEVFYSPISSWFLFFSMLTALIIPQVTEVLFGFFTDFSFQGELLFALVYLLVAYVIVARLNRSFAISDNEFLVINFLFPFRGVERFKFEEVREIRICSSWKLYPLLLFGGLNNYIQIKVGNQEKKFYCLFLEVDCYDENWTGKTLDDLHVSLNKKGVDVKMEI